MRAPIIPTLINAALVTINVTFVWALGLQWATAFNIAGAGFVVGVTFALWANYWARA